MLKEKTGIGPGLLFIFLFSSLFGFGLMTSPYVAAKYIGPNGYLGLIVAMLLTVPVIVVLVRLGNKFPDKSIIEYLPIVFGKVPGKVVGFIYLAFLLALTVSATRSMAEEFNVYFLMKTPVWAIAAIMLLSVAYLAHKGIEGITRLAAFVFPLAFIFIILSMMLAFQNFQPDHIRPVFNINLSKLSLGSIQMFYVFFPLATVFISYQYLTEKQKGQNILLGATLLAFVPILGMVLGAIGMYGAKGILRYNWPVLEMIRTAMMPFLLETFDLFFTITWLSQLYIAIGGFYFAAAQGSSELFETLNYKWFVIALFPVILGLTLLPPSLIEVHIITDYLRIVGFMVVFALPLIVWLIAGFRNRGGISDVY